MSDQRRSTTEATRSITLAGARVGGLARRDTSWTLGDDRDLVRFARKRLGVEWRHRSFRYGDARAQSWAAKRGRTLGGVMARWQTLRTCLAYLALSGAGLGVLDWGKDVRE